MTVIAGYTLTTDFSTAGGGQCRWAFATRGGEDFFLKEFLSPTHPLPEGPGSAATKARKKARCDDFENHHRQIMASLSGLSSPGGNLVIARDFFRYQAHYYKITDKIDVSSLPLDQIHRLEPLKQLILAATVAHSLQILHKVELVHGDIKPANVLLKETARKHYAAKLIDFDDAYFSRRPVQVEDLIGDIAYYSPETHLYVQGECAPEALHCQSDIYSLGILFTEYFTGAKPQFDADSCAAGTLDRQKYRTGLEVDWPEMDSLIRGMLRLASSERPGIAEVINGLKAAMRERKDGRPDEPGGTRLRGKLLEQTRAARESTTPDAEVTAAAPRLRGSLLGNRSPRPRRETDR